MTTGPEVPVGEARAALRRTPLRRRTPLEPAPGPARKPSLIASAEQRAKVAGQSCLVCAKQSVDPAHVIARAAGGCNAPACVVPLCRPHHRAYDRGELDLLPHLEPARRLELAHAVAHVGLIATLRRVTGRRDVAGSVPVVTPSVRSVARMSRTADRVPLDEPLMTVQEIADAFAVTAASAYGYARRKTDPLPCIRLGGRLRFSRREVEQWLARQRGQASA